MSTFVYKFTMQSRKKMKFFNVLAKSMCFILKNMSRVKKHVTVGFVLRDRFLMSLKLTIIGN
jgi:hypothetical protein